MKKFSLILAFILVFTCCMFAACGDDENTSSAASSAAAESSEAPAASSEAASADASSEAASSEAAAASSEAVSDIETSGATGETGTNVALNKSYTGGDPCGVPDTAYTALLTDGLAADSTNYNNDWFGFYHHATPADPSYLNTADGVGTVIIDLGEAYSNISKIRVHVWNCNASGILAAKSINASVSNGGEGYTDLGAVPVPEADAPSWAELTIDGGATGRYVKVEIACGGVWTFLNEIEVILG